MTTGKRLIAASLAIPVALAMVVLACFGGVLRASSVSDYESSSRNVEGVTVPQVSQTGSKTGDSCAACHREKGDEVIGLFGRSTHFRRSISCANCHGGTPSAAEKSAAHVGSFVGRPDPSQILTMCGSCHTSQLAVFKTSRHYVSGKAIPRVDCSQCHGAHTVGGQASTFSISYYCAGCHGLEYLPSLPRDLREVLDQSDKIREAVRAVEQSGKRPSDEAAGLRRQVRRLTADVVHATDLEGGTTKIPEIRKLNDSLLVILERDKSRAMQRN
ncbi:MAG TPA: cytochrome c3 family protein [Blastocatellia bacterium]|nr:cytochrome c3 family protein [Blastocatellia bacterium]